MELYGLGSLYGIGYWPQLRHRRNDRKLRLFWELLMSSMALLVVSRHAMAFLFGWEVMALSAFFLVTTEDHQDESRRVGWIYFVATHIRTLTLFALYSDCSDFDDEYDDLQEGVVDAVVRAMMRTSSADSSVN